MRKYNTVTRKGAEELIQHNKRQSSPSHTAVVNAISWLRHMDTHGTNELLIYCGDK